MPCVGESRPMPRGFNAESSDTARSSAALSRQDSWRSGWHVHRDSALHLAGAGRGDLGNFVRVRHPLGFVSTYGHLSRIEAHVGKIVIFRSLTVFGQVGSTGRSTGPHLHFALQAFGAYLPPRFFLIFHSLRRVIVGL